MPPVGRVEFLRAPTSDVNVTIGLALVAFFIFEVEGFRRLGFGGYLPASSSRSTSSRTASARASSPCSWASWS